MGGNPSNKLEKQIHLLNSPSGNAHSTSRTKKKHTKNTHQAKFNKSIIHCELFTSFYSKHCQDMFVYFHLEFKKIHGNIAVCLCSSTKSRPALLFWMPLFNQRKATEQERTKAKFTEEKTACVCNASFHCV